MPDYRSVSQYKTFHDCGYRYYLERVARVWQKPAAWLGQGTAVHAAAEAYERSERRMTLGEVEAAFIESYADTVNKSLEDTPNFEFWFASGPYRGAADIERRFKLGLEQCKRYIDWYDRHAEEVVWINDDGTPGIELKFDIELDKVRVLGFIDAIIYNETTDRTTVRDNKTGNKPGDDFQLAVYAIAMNKTFDTDITHGDYWMGRTGKPTVQFDLRDWSEERLTHEFGEMDAAVRAEEFKPNPEASKCRFCSVSSSCPYSAF